MKLIIFFQILLSLGITVVKAEEPEIPAPIRWKQVSFTKEELILHLEKRIKFCEEQNAKEDTTCSIPKMERYAEIFENYETGDEIIQYNNRLFHKRMGRIGYALIRGQEVIVNVVVLMN